MARRRMTLTLALAALLGVAAVEASGCVQLPELDTIRGEGPSCGDPAMYDDGNPCTDDVCENGAPAHKFSSKETKCGANNALACNGEGKCVCDSKNSGVDCGASTECGSWSCSASICEYTSHEPPQTASDCKKHVCDARGVLNWIADTMDVPADDGEPCTIEQCNGDLPELLPKPKGTLCGAPGFNDVCDSAGKCDDCDTIDSCVRGMTCSMSTDCGGDDSLCADGVCCNEACTGLCESCASPTPGTCTQVMSGQKGKCSDSQVCTDSAECKTALGGVCMKPGMLDATCANGNCCPSGKCGKKPGGACSVFSECCSNSCTGGVCS